jgi:predicted DNA-binding transcriptional regulator AlpA
MTHTMVDVTELVGIREIAHHFDVSRPTVCKWRTRHPAFPEPVCHVSAAPVFLWPEVVRWYDAMTSARRTP